jgi:cystathionine beta-lyase
MPDPARPKPATRIVHAGRAPLENHGAVNPPVHHASTILKPGYAEWMATRQPGYDGYQYGLAGTPTSRAFEAALAELYGVSSCVAVSSGLAAVTVAILALTRAGDDILVTDSAYEPTRRFCDGILGRYGVTTRYYDPGIGGGIARLMEPRTRVVFTESPGSMSFEMQDVPAIAAAAKAAGARVIFDNSWGTALNYNPFRHGVDIVVEAVTKYVGGHSDLLMGAVLSEAPLARRLFATAKGLGICCGADDLYLAQRGLRTLAIRLERSAATGLGLARWLQSRPEVARVLHPGLPEDSGHALWRRDFTGAAGLFGVLLHPVAEPALARFFDGLRLFGLGASWGGYESLIMPCFPATTRSAVPWTEPGPLIRLHAGLEDADDLIHDLEDGFARMAACSG